MKRCLVTIALLVTGVLVQAQPVNKSAHYVKNFLQHFSLIPEQDRAIATNDPFHFKSYKYNGHIQGIQLYEEAGTDYLYMTRSSPVASFMIKAKWDSTTATPVAVDTLMQMPYGHPGGFQLYKNYLAVGIEDEKARTTSRVVVYDLKRKGSPWTTPLHVIKRDGKYERVTAGCVGITKLGNQILVAVGNWDSRDIDFYVCPEKKFIKGKGEFKLIQSITITQVDKEEWSDPAWLSYQNINLFAENDKLVYMVGFAGKGVDLFELNISSDGLDASAGTHQNTIHIKKVQSRVFKVSGNASFGAGAGISYTSNGKMIMLAAPDDLGAGATISVYNADN